MLDPSVAFSPTAGLAVMACWLGLILSLFVKPLRPVAWTAGQIVAPALLAIAYILLLWGGRDAFEDGGFGSMAELRTLFAHDSALAAGWLHYLAFDLFVGTWIAREGIEGGVPRLLILPCLPLTFLFGPSGLLLFLILRAAFGRRAQPEA